jgi:effector-binding domain-containing protein
LSKNLFGNCTSKKEENNNNRSNLYNSNFRSPLNMKYSDSNRCDNYDIKSRSYNYVTPKKLFKNPNDNDFSNNINDYNSKFNSNNLSLNSNSYTTLSNRALSNHKTYDEIDKAYKSILNSIDETLNDINRRKNQGNRMRALSSSIDKVKPFSSSNHKIHKNSFRYLSLTSKKNYYKDICDKFDKYNGFKMTRRYLIKDKI